MAPSVQQRGAMLELAKPETRAAAHSHSGRFTWGIVDGILGLVMLPFAVWMAAIEAVVHAAAWLFDFDSRRANSVEPPTA